jgi:hypothetical protein
MAGYDLSPTHGTVPTVVRQRRAPNDPNEPNQPGDCPRLVLTDPGHVERAATALARGGLIGHGFANSYAITTRPDAATVRRVNLMKGRPAGAVGSIVTAPDRIAAVFDWSRLPAGLTPHLVARLIETLYAFGPFGIRGPAAAHVPPHLTRPDGGVATTQVVSPGAACPSRKFLSRALTATGSDILHITSASRSEPLASPAGGHRSGRTTADQAAGVRAEFGRVPGFALLEHADDEVARRAYPRFAQCWTTTVAFHRTAGTGEDGRPVLWVERHGSLAGDDLRAIVEGIGLGLCTSVVRRNGTASVHRTGGHLNGPDLGPLAAGRWLSA